MKICKNFAIFCGLFAYLCALISADRGLRATDACTEVRRMFAHKGLNYTVPRTAIRGSQLKVCQRSYTCCTPQIEDQLHAESVIEFEKKLSDKSMLMRAQYEKKHQEFNDLFKKLIATAKEQLDSLFEATYNDKYKENALIFMELFDDLDKYYAGASVDINDIFDKFFVSVMQGVFKLLNPSFAIDDVYNQCMADNMRHIRPFGDTPKVITSQVRRSFIAARTFVRGLEKGKQTASEIATVYPTTECAKGLTKMSYCSKCQGYAVLKPCHEMCLNVMKGCLCDITDINNPWNRYTSQMSLLLSRLEGPFNIATILDQIDVKISTAIMLPQDNKIDFVSKVLEYCGSLESDSSNKPVDFDDENSKDGYSSYEESAPKHANEEQSNRNKRSIEDDIADQPGSYDNFNPRYRQSKKHRNGYRKRILYRSRMSSMRGNNAGLAELKRLTGEMKDVLQASKNYWKELPETVCSQEAAKPNSTACWNGEVKGRYALEVTKDGIRNQRNNPEVSVNADREPDFVIRKQITAVNEMTEELKLAYRGVDPALADDDGMDADEIELYDEGSAEGSGEGSGDENQNFENNRHNRKHNNRNFKFDVKEIEGKFFRDLKKWEQDFLEEIFKERIPGKTPLVALHKKWSKHPSNNRAQLTTKAPGGDATALYNNKFALIIMTSISLLLAV